MLLYCTILTSRSNEHRHWASPSSRLPAVLIKRNRCTMYHQPNHFNFTVSVSSSILPLSVNRITLSTTNGTYLYNHTDFWSRPSTHRNISAISQFANSLQHFFLFKVSFQTSFQLHFLSYHFMFTFTPVSFYLLFSLGHAMSIYCCLLLFMTCRLALLSAIPLFIASGFFLVMLSVLYYY